MLAFFIKIFFCLLIAAGIGFLMAWLLRGLSLNRLREHNYRLTSDLSARDNQVSVAQSQIQDLRAKQALIERDLETSKARTADLQLALTGEQERTIKVEDDLRQEHERLLALQSIATQRTAELEANKSLLVNTAREKDAEVSRLNSQLTPLMALPAALASRETDLRSLQTRLDETASARSRAEAELSQVRTALDVSRREHEEQLSYRSQKILELEREQASDRSRLAELDALAQRRASEADALRGDIATLQERISSSQREKDTEIARLSAQLSPLLGLPASLAARDNELKIAQQKLVEASNALRAKDQEMSSTRSRIENELNAVRGRSDGEVSQLKARVASFSSEMQSRDSTLATLRVELEAARKTLESRSALLRESEAAKAAAADALKAKDSELLRLRAELAAQLQENALSRRNLEAQLQAPQAGKNDSTRQTPRQFASAPPQIDDLKHIYGVGPALEKLLHSLGVYQFRQVSLWNADDVSFFDSQLHEFRGRIEREQWIRSAQEEHYKKYGEWLGEGPPAITIPETNR